MKSDDNKCWDSGQNIQERYKYQPKGWSDGSGAIGTMSTIGLHDCMSNNSHQRFYYNKNTGQLKNDNNGKCFQNFVGGGGTWRTCDSNDAQRFSIDNKKLKYNNTIIPKIIEKNVNIIFLSR